MLESLADPIARADLLYFAQQPEAAHELLVKQVQSEDASYEALWRAARAAVVVGLFEEDNRAQNRYLDPALEYGRRAVALRPDGIDGLYWRGVAAGRRAMNAAPGYAVELAQITYADAQAILAADSLHGGAHNMLGKLNYEVMSISRLERAIARLFLGNDAIRSASWEQAEEHLQRAVDAAPEYVLFQYDLGVLLERRGRDEEAIPHLEEALRRPDVQPIDPVIKERARALLEKVQG